MLRLVISGGFPMTGRCVIPALAEEFQQLYIAPGSPGAEGQYSSVVRSGMDAENKKLAHFIMDERDVYELAETPAGAVRVITLFQRADFETVLCCIGNRCRPMEIARTCGAQILDGVVCWKKIREHEQAFLQSGGSEEDWAEEFHRFTSDRRNYLDALIVLSVGPYSAVPAEETGFSEEEWLAYSHSIRKYHECTHFLCRRMFPEQIEPLWDELVADAAGLYAAFGRYDIPLAERFLGIREGRYVGGRLQNYVPKEEYEQLSAIASQIHSLLPEIEKIAVDFTGSSPFDLAIALEKRQNEMLPPCLQKKS